jgi:DNA-binding FadR family transcriptional regulator
VTPGRAGGPTFGPARRVRSFDDVVEQVRRSIVDGVIEAGDRLPSEREMAEQFGVSRATLREALRALEALGLLEIRRGAQGGAFAVDATPERLIVQIRELLAVEAARNPDDARGFRASFHADNLRWVRLSDQVVAELTTASQRGATAFLVAVASATAMPMRGILAEAVEAVNHWSTGSAELEVAHMRRVIDLLRAGDRDAACDLLVHQLLGSTQAGVLS